MTLDELPRHHFGTALIDAPWRFETWSNKGKGRSAEKHYKTMTDEELASLPIAELMLPNAAVLLWSSGPFLQRSLALLEAWGCRYVTIPFVWIKPSIGLGFWTRACSELVLLGVFGRPRRLEKGVPQEVHAMRREHSRKPEIRDRIERVFFGPYVEMFGRQSRDNWMVHGDEAGKFDE